MVVYLQRYQDSLQYLIMERLVEDLGGIMYGCTVAEAARLGRYFCCTLQLIKKWREDQDTFEEEMGRGNHVAYQQFIRLIVIWEVTLRGGMCYLLLRRKG